VSQLFMESAAPGSPSSSSRVVLFGRQGMRALSGPVAVSAADPEHFRADYSRLTIDDVLIERFAISEHTGVRSAGAGIAEQVISVMLLIDGLIRVRRGSSAYTLEPGSVCVLPSGGPLEYQTEGPIRAHLMTTVASALPPGLLANSQLPVGPLVHTRAVATFTVLIRQFCVGTLEPVGAAGPHLARGLLNMQFALIAEAMNAVADDHGIDALRYRIKDHIDRNLGDPALSPHSIATSLGVSVRYVHRCFNSPDVSVAKYIRERRLEAVAAAVASEQRVHRIDALAERFGFAGRDQLTRAFRIHYGTTIRGYESDAS
jgi:AraC-like DNA-binding protein